ncbi:unnamed protein product, partial [Candidula unifasciata]
FLSRKINYIMSAGARSFGFGLKAFKRFPELVPLVSILSAACLGGTGFIVYSLATKPDVRVIKSKGPAYEDVNPTENRKLVQVNKDHYQPIPELEELRKEIGHYKP